MLDSTIFEYNLLFNSLIYSLRFIEDSIAYSFGYN